MLTDGPTGTDLGMVPSLAARELDVIALRATATDAASEGFHAVILEVFDPSADDVLKCRRNIAAADDGGRWTFEQYGVPFEFEETSAYSRPRIRDRFTRDMLIEYLAALGVPIDTLPDLATVIMIDGG